MRPAPIPDIHLTLWLFWLALHLAAQQVQAFLLEEVHVDVISQQRKDRGEVWVQPQQCILKGQVGLLPSRAHKNGSEERELADPLHLFEHCSAGQEEIHKSSNLQGGSR